MKGHFYRPKCKCPKELKDKNKCKCGASWGFMTDVGQDPKTGDRKQKGKSGFKTLKEAQAAHAKFITELNQGTYIEESDITFETYSKEWISNYGSTGKVKPGTVRIRKKQINRLLDYFAKLKLKNITKKQYQNALIDLLKRGYADNTMDGIHVTGRMIFKEAVIDEIINKDPTEGAYVPRKPKTVEELENEEGLPKYLEKVELALFLKTAKERGLERDYAVFMSLAYSGIRIGELCALKWRDIDFENKTMRITKTYKNDQNNIKKYELGTPKTESSVRQIEVGEEIINALNKHKAHQNKIKMRYRDRYYDQGYVFSELSKKYAGYPTYPKKFENRMERLLKMTGINHELTPHSLRHTHTSLLAEAGVDLIYIKERLGHSDDDVTEKIYLHVTKDRKKETAAIFSEHLRGLF